ncbi:hypothetical protein Tco_0169131 [Tanacetum coccineum]
MMPLVASGGELWPGLGGVLDRDRVDMTQMVSDEAVESGGAPAGGQHLVEAPGVEEGDCALAQPKCRSKDGKAYVPSRSPNCRSPLRCNAAYRA